MYGFIVDSANGFISLLGVVLNAVFVILPNTPFNIDLSPVKSVMGYLNYFIPITGMVKIFTTYLFAEGIYHMVQVALRWLGVID